MLFNGFTRNIEKLKVFPIFPMVFIEKIGKLKVFPIFPIVFIEKIGKLKVFTFFPIFPIFLKVFGNMPPPPGAYGAMLPKTFKNIGKIRKTFSFPIFLIENHQKHWKIKGFPIDLSRTMKNH